MPNGSHNYHCVYCRRFILGETAQALAENVNVHNATSHPADFASWTASEIVCSCNYSGTGTPLPQYTAPYGTTSKSEWGNAKKPPEITDEDHVMLTQAGIKW